jgi:hypothetical protein
MKLVLAGAIAFVVGLGVATGVVVWRTPPRPAAADSAHADSTGVAEEEPVTASPVASAPAVVPVGPPQPAAAPDSAARAAGAAPSPAATEADAPLPPARGTERDVAVYKRVGQILVAMKPASAAAIMARLSDDQLEGVIRTLGVRQAAAMLAQLPADRAAAMSRRLIERPASETP